VNDFRDEPVPWVGTAAAPPDEETLEIGARAADAIVGSLPSKKIEAVLARSTPTLAAGLLRYGPHAVLTAWLVGVAWMVGSSFIGPDRTVIHQESVKSAEMGPAEQKMAEKLRAQKAEVEATHAVQNLSTKNVTGLANVKPHLDAPKPEISAAIVEPSGKIGHLRRKSTDRLSKADERLDRVGLKIAALLAGAPVVDHSVSAAPVAQRRTQGRRHDAFDPSLNPTAPGAPRPLGTVAPPATANSPAAQYAFGQRTN
jgi:hypothetical protein